MRKMQARVGNLESKVTELEFYSAGGEWDPERLVSNAANRI